MSETAAKEMKVPREAAAEAAVWLARLHGPHRCEELEREFREWLGKTPVNAAAFERATATWDSIDGISAAAAFRARAVARSATPRFAWAAAATATLVVAVTAGYLWLRDPVYSTNIGEQRTITLVDGSRVLMNTRTRLVTHAFNKGPRLVELEEGEALFEVAKDPSRPFVVDAGAKKITALGTIFTVRRDGRDVSVILIEGKVAVSDAREAAPAAILAPGQRLTTLREAPAAIDMPGLDQVLAWKRGEILFDATPLADAVREMNRYGITPLAIEGEAGGLKVSGIFRAGDSEAFAHAVASVHGVSVSRDSGRIVLTHR